MSTSMLYLPIASFEILIASSIISFCMSATLIVSSFELILIIQIMADSPYLPQAVKDYVRKFSLDTLINSTVNEVVKAQPEDPFGFMIGLLQKSASSDVQILQVKAFEHVSGEGFGSLKIRVKASYLNKPIQFILGEPLGILDDQAIQFDADRLGGKGASKAVAVFNEKIAQKVQQYKCSEQADIDKQLLEILAQTSPSSLYAVNSLSFSLPRITSHVTSQPLYQVISKMADNTSPIVPEYMVNCLEGGKAIGSKCKVFKYSIISNKNKHDPFLAQTILAAVRKAIVGGKGGEAALKFSPDRTFICPVDTILDNLKIVEEAINSSDAKQHFKVGLSWAADTLFSPDTKKYELENPKTPFDNDQMIDYLVKLVTDKPVIGYLEDPLASSEKAAWKKLKTKLQEQEATKHVTLGTRNEKLLNLYGSSDDLKTVLDQLSIPCTTDTHPQLSQQELNAKNADKFSLHFIHAKAFQLKTLSNLLSIQKLLNKSKTRLILQDNLYETYDTSLVDICAGSGAVMNLSTINQGKYDRVVKLTRINEIFQAGANDITQ